MNEFENKVLNTISKYNMFNYGETVVVGLSGGVDSCTLLTVLKNLSDKLGLTIIAAHLNHGIRGDEALRDMQFSEQFAQKLDVRFVSKTVSVLKYAKQNKISEEMAGRELRYAFFRDICSKYNASKIAVAHNLNDRAETVILNLIRGSGARGLRGIKPCNDDIVRPLIDVTRFEIESYASDLKISYVTDSTNAEDKYARNIVRNRLFSQMTKINSNALENIIRSSDIITSESESLDNLIEKLCPIEVSSSQATIDRAGFFSLEDCHKRRVLISAVEAISDTTTDISYAQLENAIKINATGKKFKFANNVNLIYTNSKIILTCDNFDIPSYEYNIFTDNICYVPETNTSYKFELTDKYDKEPLAIYISADNIDCKKLILRTKKDGDTFLPSGFNGTKKVKKFFIDSKIPSHSRNLYPLLLCNDEVLAILPLRVSSKYTVDKQTKKILKISVLGGTYE